MKYLKQFESTDNDSPKAGDWIIGKDNFKGEEYITAQITRIHSFYSNQRHFWYIYHDKENLERPLLRSEILFWAPTKEQVERKKEAYDNAQRFDM